MLFLSVGDAGKAGIPRKATRTIFPRPSVGIPGFFSAASYLKNSENKMDAISRKDEPVLVLRETKE